MKRREHRLIDEIEQDVLNPQTPLADALRKCVILGGKAGSAELREWAIRELRGYQGSDELPEYRKVGAVILADAFTGSAQIRGQQISPMSLPSPAREHIKEEVEFRNGVGEIEGALKQAEAKDGAIHVSLPHAMEIGALIDKESPNPFQHIQALYWSVSATSLHGLLDQIRTTLAQLVAELQATMPPEQEVPTADQTRQAVSVAVHGRRSTVTVNTTQASSDTGTASAVTAPAGQSVDQTFWTRGRKVGAFVVGLATVAGGVIAIIQFVHH